MLIDKFHRLHLHSGHPLAMAAGIATLEVYKEQKIFENAARMAPVWEEKLHSLKGLPHVVDIRNIGMMGAVEMAPAPGANGALRAKDVWDRSFAKGLHYRYSNCTLALSPPLVCEEKDIDKIVSILGDSIEESAKQFKVHA
jgi:beta-alanine--pyruvate transaminase